MIEFINIDDTYAIYEKRYEFNKLAIESGLDIEEFNKMSSRDKFLTLSYRLKELNRVHLASFFFGKLFEITKDLEALINKVDCLLILGEYDEAYRFNCMGFELYMEELGYDYDFIERVLSYQKALIAFYTERYDMAEIISEDNIIKYDQVESYILLTAIFIIRFDFEKAIKLFNRYSYKLKDSYDYLVEVVLLLLTVNKKENVAQFLVKLSNSQDKDIKDITQYLNNFYAITRNKEILKEFLKKEIQLQKICNNS